MRHMFEVIALIAAMFFAMLVAQEWGRRWGVRRLARAASQEFPAHGPTENAVFALLGLFIAFTFAGAGGRFDDRRHLIVEETNAIGTAWLRLDLLPADRQPGIRALFREYVDARIETYRRASVGEFHGAAHARALALQQRIWHESVGAAAASGQGAPQILLLPALNAMFDIVTSRIAATRMHAPVAVFGMIALLAIVGAVFVGYGLAGDAPRTVVHTFAFASVLSFVIYVIVDLEFPRLGLIRVDDMDRLLTDLRASMG